MNSNPGAELVRKRWEKTTPEMRREFMAYVRAGRSIPILKGQIIELKRLVRLRDRLRRELGIVTGLDVFDGSTVERNERTRPR